MKTIFFRINRFFALTRKDRNGIYVLLFLIVITVALRSVYPFWKTGIREFSDTDVSAAIAVATAGKATFSGNYIGSGTQYANKGGQRADDSTIAAQDKPRMSNYTPPAYMQKKQFIASLNEADTTDLKELKGIGSGFARRIVAYREKLGGFVRKEQLREVWGIDSALYTLMAPQITINAENIRKININTATIDILKRHPYLDYYLAKEIVKYRDRYGAFAVTDDLLKVNLMDEGTFHRIKPYLTVE